MSKLFSPLAVRSLTLRNRIVVSPMCQYSATDGFLNDWHLVHLGARATGGAALVIQEATAVSPEGRISYGDAGIWKDEHIAPAKRVVDFIRSQGAVAGIQLSHAGRKASVEVPWNGDFQIKEGPDSWTPVSSSAIPFREGDVTPIALDIEGIDKVIDDFRAATKRALDAGYQVIEIHGAHGYLITQFLSPLVNKRTDEYGGSFDNRIRFLLQIVDAVKEVWPEDLPLFVRLSATDWAEGGWEIEQSVRLASILKDKGIDLIDSSSGGVITGVRIPLSPGYQVPLAEGIKKGSGIMTGAVGLITTATQAEEILQNNQADLVFLAREFLRDPYFPMHAARELKAEISWPVQYERAKPKD